MNSPELLQLTERMNRIERTNKRLKLGLAGLLSLGALGLMSAAPVCKTIWGEVSVLRDSDGHKRVTWDAYHEQEPTLTFINGEGAALATMAFDESGSMALQVRRDGKLRPAYLTLLDEKPQVKAQSCSGSTCDSKNDELPDVN